MNRSGMTEVKGRETVRQERKTQTYCHNIHCQGWPMDYFYNVSNNPKLDLIILISQERELG